MILPFKWDLCFARYSLGTRLWSRSVALAATLSRRHLSKPSSSNALIMTRNPWKGLVGKDGKLAPRGTPSANAVVSDPENAYGAMAGKSFIYHFGR